MTVIRSAVLPSLLAAALAAGASTAEAPRTGPASAGATRPAARTEAATGNAPAADEWRKVQLAIEADAKEAGAALADITRRYPRWGDGWRAQATWQLRKGLRTEAAASAKNGLAAGDAPCAALLARALVESGRAKEALAVVAVEAERGGDGDGWLSYWGGEAALDLNDLDKARDMVARAQARAGAKVPAWFLLLEARLKLRTKSWAEAETLLERATAARAELLDAWYELGRVRLLRAELEPEGAETRLRKADEAFRTALIGRPGDAGVRLGAARAALGLGRLAAAAGQETEATSQFRRAAETLEPVLKATPDDRDARVTAGEARLRLGDWATAAEHLGRARALGAKDHSLPFNLAMALQNSGRQAEAAAALQGLSATTPPEQVAVGMGAWSAGDAVLAARMLGDAATALTASDPVNAGACWRFAGHAHRRAADRLGADAGKEREQELDAAADCWAKAGDLKDYEARRFLIAQESARDPVRAYAVAWKQIDWEDGISLAGWRLALANYAGAVTRGQGLAGMAANAPLHLAGWLALVLLPLALFAWALVRRRRPPAAPEPGTRATELTTPRPATTRPVPPPPPARPTPTKPLITPRPPTRTPAPQPARRPTPLAVPQRPTPRPTKVETEPLLRSPEEKAETATVARSPARPNRTPAKGTEKAETLEIPRPRTLPTPAPGLKPKPGGQGGGDDGASAAEATLKPTIQKNAGGALERRKP